jgi:hypothetical protein
MGVIDYAKSDVQALQDNDEDIAKQFDARQRDIQRVIDRAKVAAE